MRALTDRMEDADDTACIINAIGSVERCRREELQRERESASPGHCRQAHASRQVHETDQNAETQQNQRTKLKKTVSSPLLLSPRRARLFVRERAEDTRGSSGHSIAPRAAAPDSQPTQPHRSPGKVVM